MKAPREREDEAHDVRANLIVEDLPEIGDPPQGGRQALGSRIPRAGLFAAPAASASGAPHATPRAAGRRTQRRRRPCRELQPKATARHHVGDVSILLTRSSRHLIALAKSTAGRFRATYHPEQHYMRGPG